MRWRVFVPLFLVALVAGTVVPTRSQSEQDKKQVIDDFTRTRGADFALPEKTPKKAAAGKAKTNSKKTAPRQKPDSDVNTRPGSGAGSNSEAVAVPVGLSTIGLGYTIFLYKPGTDEAVAVGPEHVHFPAEFPESVDG